jgi:hypothetical protein
MPMPPRLISAYAAIAVLWLPNGRAADADIENLQDQINAMKAQYESRIVGSEPHKNATEGWSYGLQTEAW